MLLINSICLVVSSPKCKEDSYRPKYTTSFFYSVSKETTHKTSKVAATKNFSSSVYVVDTTCFDECFLFHLITGVIVFCKSLSLLWDSSSRHIVAFFETSVLRKVRILCYLNSNSAVLISKFQNKAIVYFT